LASYQKNKKERDEEEVKECKGSGRVFPQNAVQLQMVKKSKLRLFGTGNNGKAISVREHVNPHLIYGPHQHL
jgi:hypothetical protein